MKQKYSDEELINYLINYYDEFDKVPTTRDIKNNPNYPTDETFRSHFGSWKEALKRANLYSLRKDKHLFDRKTYTDDELLKLLNEFTQEYILKHNELPTTEAIGNNKNMPSRSMYLRFGGFVNALELLGYEVNPTSKAMKNTKQKENKTLLNELICVLNNYGKISCKEFDKYGLCEYQTYLKRFSLNGYYDLLLLVGFDEYAEEIRYIEDEEIIDIFINIKDNLKHIPTIKEIEAYAKENNVVGITRKIYWRWGSYTEFLKSINKYKSYRFKIQFSDDGKVCLSTYEQIISNILYHNNIEYEKDVPYKKFISDFKKEYTIDYYLPQYDLYIEMFGIVGIPSYDEKIIEKQKLLKDNNLILISIFPKDFQDNNYIMDDFILSKIKLIKVN